MSGAEIVMRLRDVAEGLDRESDRALASARREGPTASADREHGVTCRLDAAFLRDVAGGLEDLPRGAGFDPIERVAKACSR